MMIMGIVEAAMIWTSSLADIRPDIVRKKRREKRKGSIGV